MLDQIGLGAVRRLTVDIANLTGQLAIAQSGIEYLQQIAAGVQPDSWSKVMGEDENGHAEMHATLEGEQIEAVVRLLAALDALG